MRNFVKLEVVYVLYLWVSASVGIALLQASPAVLTNDDIVQMIKVGLSPALITYQIRSAVNRFDLSTNEVIWLSKAGVPDNVIAAMRNPGTLTSASGGTVTPSSGGKTVAVPHGGKVRLLLMEDTSSSTAHEGDRVHLIETHRELSTLSQHFLLLSFGNLIYGHRTFRDDYVLPRLDIFSDGEMKGDDGQAFRLRATSGREGDDKLGKTVVVAVLAGPFGLLVKAKDGAFPKDTGYTAYQDEGNKEVVIGKVATLPSAALTD